MTNPLCDLCHRAHSRDPGGSWEACMRHLQDLCHAMNDEICQIAGKALGYPWFKDDQKNFPGATGADGVCVGDHVAESIVEELARRFREVNGGGAADESLSGLEVQLSNMHRRLMQQERQMFSLIRENMRLRMLCVDKLKKRQHE